MLRVLFLTASLAVALLFAEPLAAQTNVGAAPNVANAEPPLRRDQRRVTVAVATRDLARGTVLQDTDIAHKDTVITWRWSGTPDSTAVIAGWVTHRAIVSGEVLRAPAVSAPAAVTGGRPVTAIWQDGAVRLVITGVAINTAAVGAPVGVRIDRSRRLDGIAVAPNTVRIR